MKPPDFFDFVLIWLGPWWSAAIFIGFFAATILLSWVMMHWIPERINRKKP